MSTDTLISRIVDRLFELTMLLVVAPLCVVSLWYTMELLTVMGGAK